MAYLSTSTIIALVRVSRPIHWVKNLGIFAALVFSGFLLKEDYFVRVFWAFWIFNLATSATYTFNDILDKDRDKLHPRKKFRPIAHGDLPVFIALVYASTLAIIALLFAFYLSYIFFLLVLSYLFLQIAYSLFLKNIHIIDILIIAAGFIIRIYSGAFVINAHLSVWFLLCVISTALFLASGKRRAEMGRESHQETRKSLQKYSIELLNSYVTMFGNAAWMSWSLFTFFESPQASAPFWLLLAELSKTTTVDKLLMSTIPVTIFAIMKYQSLIFEGRSEAPERVLLTDTSLVTSVVIWIVMVVWVLYSGVAVHPL